MYIILNLGLSDSFQTVRDHSPQDDVRGRLTCLLIPRMATAQIEFDSLVFPALMKIDYVRVYQREGETNVGCDPDSHPTAKYIQE
jgi:hypothetical protein